MSSVATLITEIQASFDVTPADALTVLDRRHKSMCDRARWWREERVATASAGPFGGTSFITVPSDAVEIASIQVTDATTLETAMYHRTRTEDIEAISRGTLVLCGVGGVFVEQSQPLNTVSLLLYPAVAAGATILLQGAYTPPDLTNPGNIAVPADFEDGLLAGVYASLLSRPNEARPDLAAAQEQLFQLGCTELADRALRRYRTKGPRQIRLGGFDA